MKGRNDEDWAVFWCSLLSPVLLGEIPERQRERYFQELSREERRLPNGQRRRLSVRTLRRQWRRLKDEGVPGLYRRGVPIGESRGRSMPTLLARAVELEEGAAATLGQGHQSHPEAGVRTVAAAEHPLSAICDAKAPRGASWACRRRRSAVAGHATSPARCGSATSNTDRW